MSDSIKRIVVKEGTNVLTNKDNRIIRPVLKELTGKTNCGFIRKRYRGNFGIIRLSNCQN